MTATQLPDAWNPKKPTLFSLSDEMLALDALLTESGGELTPNIEAWFDAHRDALSDKVDSTAWFVRTCEARIAGFKAAEAELASKRHTEQNKIERIKSYVRACMELQGTRKLEGTVYTFAIQANGGLRPLRLLPPYDADPSELPEEYQQKVITVNTVALRLDVETGNAQTIAVLEPRGEHLRLR